MHADINAFVAAVWRRVEVDGVEVATTTAAQSRAEWQAGGFSDVTRTVGWR